mgnify:CR=1 FL=1
MGRTIENCDTHNGIPNSGICERTLKGPLGLRSGMDTVGLATLGIWIALFGIAWLSWKQKVTFDVGVDELLERLEQMERGMEVIAGVLSRLPDLMPAFSINQSPIGQLLEFFQTMRENATSSDTLLRGDDGRFTDADSSTEESSREGPSG